MKQEQVPQDNSQSYSGHNKVIYAVNSQGHYQKTPSSGWEPEEFVTMMAVDELNALTEQARQRVLAGQSSTLEFYMYQQRMDIATLASCTGFWQWQVKRHLKPVIFAKLSDAKLTIYADALGLCCSEIKSLKE